MYGSRGRRKTGDGSLNTRATQGDGSSEHKGTVLLCSTTPTGKVWSINRQYYTPTIGGVTYTTNVMGNLIYESIDRTFSYTYDGSGNISKITDRQGTNSTEKTYQYDELNQLIRENDPVAGKTTTYTYDNGGNILTKTEYAYTTGTLGAPTNTINYNYGNTEWKDLLTAYNGQNITYDQIGNPLSYYNGTQFTWNYGRKLATATTADGTNISYKYNGSEIRTQKTVNGVTTDYFLDGSTIIAQKTGNSTMWFYYDGDGTREAIEYGGNVYYYFYNAQGDVVGLFDNNLNVVVEYTYDSWGNVLSITGSLASTLGQDNPFRYRGYYYDNETGLYYLNSRYYDANTGRFVNADEAIQTGQGLLDKNMFAYCMNNPTNRIDNNGNSWKDIKEWLSNKWNTVKQWYKSYNENVKPSVDTFRNFRTVNDDVKAEMYIAAENMINANSGKSYTEKTHNEEKLNKHIGPNTMWGKHAQRKFNSFIESGGKEIVQEEYGISMNIEGLTWNELNPQQQQFIADNYLAWDQGSVFWMGVYYGHNAVKPIAESTVNARFG